MGPAEIIWFVVGVGIGLAIVFFWDRVPSDRTKRGIASDDVACDDVLHFQTDNGVLDVSWKKAQAFAQGGWPSQRSGAQAVIRAAKPGDLVVLTAEQRAETGIALGQWIYRHMVDGGGHPAVGERLFRLRTAFLLPLVWQRSNDQSRPGRG